MAWTYTKTDWGNGDFFDYTHYNRIVGNIDYLVTEFTAFTFDYSYTFPTKTINDYLTYNEHNALTEYAKRLFESYVWHDEGFAYRLGAVAGHPVWDALELNSIEESLQGAYDRLQEIRSGIVTLRTHRHIDLSVLTHEQLGRYVHGTLHKGYIEEIDTGSEWDMEIENYVCDGTSATWVRTGEKIFSPENINRDWEFLIKATPDDPTVTSERSTTIGITGRAASDTSGSSYYIEVGIKPTGVYLFRGGSLSGTHDRVFTCDSTKPIRVVKTGTTISFYVDDVLINTFTMTNTTGGTYSEIQYGGWSRGSGYYYFKGTIDYFKFKWNS